MTIQVAVAAAEKLPLGQSTAGTRKQYMWVVPSTFQVKTKKPPKLEDLFFLSHFFSLSLSFFLFCQFNSTQDKLKTASEAEEGEWCEAVNGGCMGSLMRLRRWKRN